VAIFRQQGNPWRIARNESKAMTNPFPTPDSLDTDAGFSPAPSISQAANYLRAAAGEKAREFIHSAETRASALKERAVESAQQFRESASEKAHHLKETAADQWEDTRVKAKELQVTAEDYIRQNPTKCVISALGLGFLIGLIVRR
jgi:ElaB/YqjD/DUF883 family membrane-anchored ribosome-binding protein